MARVRVEIDRVMKSGMFAGRPVGTMIAFMPTTRVAVRNHSRERARRARSILASAHANVQWKQKGLTADARQNRQSDFGDHSWIEEGPGLPGPYRNIDRTISLFDSEGGSNAAAAIEFGTRYTGSAVAPLRRALGIL